jgi:hypothetical protein
MQFSQRGSLPFGLPAKRLETDTLPRQRAFDKNDFARSAVFILQMTDTAAFHVERFDIDYVLLHRERDEQADCRQPVL